MKTTVLMIAFLLTFSNICSGRPTHSQLVIVPIQATLVAADETGINRIAINFDLSSLGLADPEFTLPEDSDRRRFEISEAFVQWEVDGIPSDRMTDYAVHAITAPWEPPTDGSPLQATIASTPVSTWEITPDDHIQGMGSLIRLNVRDLVRAWVGGISANHGLALSTPDLDAITLSQEIVNARLIIRYGIIDSW